MNDKCVDRLEKVLSEISKRNGALKIVTDLDAEKAFDAAKASEKRWQEQKELGPLDGLILAVKDNISVCGLRWSAGLGAWKNRIATKDTRVIKSLRDAGAIVFSMVNMHEGALGATTNNPHFGRTANPLDFERTPGGSSGGSAAAIAAGLADAALGTDTMGSVRIPAAFCGVVGYKASVGQFPLNGALTLSYSMDSLGFFVRSVEDLQLLRNVLLGVSREAAGLKPRKIGLVRTPFWSELDSESQLTIEAVGRDLAISGIELTEVDVDGQAGVNLVDAHQTLMAFEVARSRAAEYEHHREKLSDQFTQLVESGRQISYQAYEEALKQRDSANKRLHTEFADCDLFLTASAPGEAPKGLGSTGDPKFSRAWNLIGGPSVTLPAGKGRATLPLGVQLVGRLNKDDDLIAHAGWIRRELQLGSSN